MISDSTEISMLEELKISMLERYLHSRVHCDIIPTTKALINQ
jgi:hypothetical protein